MDLRVDKFRLMVAFAGAFALVCGRMRRLLKLRWPKHLGREFIPDALSRKETALGFGYGQELVALLAAESVCLIGANNRACFDGLTVERNQPDPLSSAFLTLRL